MVKVYPKKTRVFVAGHRGMVGSAIVRQLAQDSSYEIVTRKRDELDLISQDDVANFFQKHNIDQVYLAAAKVGGIVANNTYPADFIYENLMIQLNIIHSAHMAGIQNLLFLGSSCIYPKLAEQPMTEKSLLTGALEETNEPYAIAKIAGIKLCESYNRQFGRAYRSVMPTNLYGPNDNFHQENSHVIPGLIRRFHDAKQKKLPEVVAWGTGAPKREFLHVDDMASACIHVMNLDSKSFINNDRPMCSHINIGSGRDITIKKLTELISSVVDFKGDIRWDKTKPDGAPQKLLDVGLINKLNWQSSIELVQGLELTYEWFQSQSELRL